MGVLFSLGCYIIAPIALHFIFQNMAVVGMLLRHLRYAPVEKVSSKNGAI